MADQVTVYFNPVCGQARGAVEILEDRGIDFELVEYLKTPLSQGDLEHILDSISDPPADLVRKDKRFAELGLDADDYQTRAQVLAVLLEHPELMQRPVVFVGDKAQICRPSDKVLELLG